LVIAEEEWIDEFIIVAEGRTWRPEPRSGRKGTDSIDQERQEFRDLIDRFQRDRATEDDGDFYRNVGRYIFRSMMARGPGDRRH
jgi:hypothetical protein